MSHIWTLMLNKNVNVVALRMDSDTGEREGSITWPVIALQGVDARVLILADCKEQLHSRPLEEVVLALCTLVNNGERLMLMDERWARELQPAQGQAERE
jgi:hypothetical protein